MNSMTYRRLALALTLGMGVSAFLPHAFAAEEKADGAPSSSEIMKPVTAAAAAREEGDAPKGTAEMTDASRTANTAASTAPADATASAHISAPAAADNAASISDERTAAWAAKRPDEERIARYLAEQVGKTVVEIQFSGASENTEKLARAALTMHVGDSVTEQALAKDRDAIYDTGYFYDLFPAFEQVPEGVILTYHVLENPILKEVKIEGNTVESTENLMGLVTVKTGEMLNARVLQGNVQAIQEKYRADGYILAKITDLNIAQDGTLTIKVSEGTLEGYQVKGNKKTKDRVVLREMRQKPGEPFNANLARRSMQRV